MEKNFYNVSHISGAQIHHCSTHPTHLFHKLLTERRGSGSGVPSGAGRGIQAYRARRSGIQSVALLKTVATSGLCRGHELPGSSCIWPSPIPLLHLHPTPGKLRKPCQGVSNSAKHSRLLFREVNSQPSTSSSTSVPTLHDLAVSICCVGRSAHCAPKHPDVSMAFCSESSLHPKT